MSLVDHPKQDSCLLPQREALLTRQDALHAFRSTSLIRETSELRHIFFILQVIVHDVRLQCTGTRFLVVPLSYYCMFLVALAIHAEHFAVPNRIARSLDRHFVHF